MFENFTKQPIFAIDVEKELGIFLGSGVSEDTDNLKFSFAFYKHDILLAVKDSLYVVLDL